MRCSRATLVERARDHILPLTPAMVALLKQALELNLGSEYVFPADMTRTRNGKEPRRPHVNGESVSHAMRRLRERIKLEDARVHDFRACLTTWLSDNGFNREVDVHEAPIDSASGRRISTPVASTCAVSVAALPLIEITENTWTLTAFRRPGGCKVHHTLALVGESAPLCGWQRLHILRPQGDEQCDDLVGEVDGHGITLLTGHRQHVYLNLQLHPYTSEKRRLDAVRMAEKKTMILTIRVEESVGKALKALAEADERKLSAYVARVLRRHIEAETKDKTKPKGQR